MALSRARFGPVGHRRGVGDVLFEVIHVSDRRQNGVSDASVSRAQASAGAFLPRRSIARR